MPSTVHITPAEPKAKRVKLSARTNSISRTTPLEVRSSLAPPLIAAL
jgi:hypothetical protein